MPCNSEHMEPSVRERHLQHASSLLLYAKDKLGDIIPQQLRVDARDIYGRNGEKNMKALCDLLHALPEKKRDALVYNARDRMARQLADWWEEHLEEDRRRAAADKEKLKTVAGAREYLWHGQDIAGFAKALGAYYKADDGHAIIELKDGVVIYTHMNGLEIWKGVKVDV